MTLTDKTKTKAKPKGKKARAIGRPTKKTPVTEKKLFDALRRGNTRRAACAYAGISEQTLSEWSNSFPEFSEACTRAENAAECGFVDVIQEAADAGDWKAGAWWLERRRKQDYASRSELTGKGGAAIQVDSPALTKAAEEMNEWRKQMTDQLSSLKPPLE